MDQSTYNDGQLNATASPVQAQDIQAPQNNFGDMSDILKRALEDQIRRKQIEQNRAAQMAAMPQRVAINRPYGNPTPNMGGSSGGGEGLTGRQALAQEQAALAGGPQGTFVRYLNPGGTSSIGGYVRAERGEPGAVASSNY